MPPKYQRRTHTKSKRGCGQCKVRRIKCNEIGPVCQNCERRQITCDFELLGVEGPVSQDDDTERTSITPPRPSSHDDGVTVVQARPRVDPFASPDLVSTKKTSELDISDLQLMHHFTTVLAYDLANQRTGQALALWQVYAVKLGFKHDFLLRGLLAISAFHQSYLKPQLKKEFDVKASLHQDFAIRSFQETLANVNESNCHALFIFSCVIIVLSFSSSSKDKASDFQIDVLHWFYLLRGCNGVLDLHRETLRASFLKPLLDELHYAENYAAHDVPDVDRILQLFSLCNISETVDKHEKKKLQACQHAVHALLSTFTQVSILRKRGEGTVLASFVWPVNLPPEFLDLLSEKHPIAMVILAHYCILIYWGEMQDTWFLVGWARYMLDTVKELTPMDWHRHLQWPNEIIMPAGQT